MKPFAHESGFAFLAIAVVTALILGLALASGACW